MKYSAAEGRSVPRETLCSCAQASRAGQERFSCEEAKHPVPLCTPLLSFLAKQDLIIITRTQKKHQWYITMYFVEGDSCIVLSSETQASQ